MAGRPPDVEVYLVTKKPESNGKRKYAKIGAGWKVFDDGTISITLNPGTFLDWRMNDDYYITLKPINNTFSRVTREPDNTEKQTTEPLYEDDIPF